jgi:hypothetical protein
MPKNLGSRRIVWLGAAAIAVAVGISGTAYVYRGGKSSALTVCQGEARQGCGGTEHWIDCGTDPIAWIRSVRPDVCINVTVKKLADAAGGQCGYTTLEIKCSSR